MSASDIRSITYRELAHEAEFSKRKWKAPNDEVFNKLGELVSEAEKVRIADFLNLFYYFIICYSKKCFKRFSVWDTSRWNKKNQYSSLTIESIKFNYELANEFNSHGRLLEIQKRMNQYRQEFISANSGALI